MLSSSSPSLLLSALSPLTVAGDAAAPATDDASGFAELLNGLAAKAAGAISGEDAGQSAAEPAAPASQTTPAKGKAITARAGRMALADKGTDVAGQPATAAVAAIESGKILPVGLPEAAEAETKTGAGAETEIVAPAAAVPSPLPAAPGAGPLVPAQAGTTDTAPAAIAPRRPATAAAQASTRKANATPDQPGDKTTPEAQTTQARPVPAVAITVAGPAPVATPVAETAADAKPAAPTRSKPTRAADLARVEAPLPPASVRTPTSSVQADQTATAANAPAPAMPAMPSPTDIDAALDQLVAAREALMPAEAALAIDHAEFGEVSIKFEQASDGRLSAELTAADPELKRAVTAAAATDRGPATSSDGDSGRSAQTASRGSATGGDAAQGERSQSGADRELPQRRASTRSPARQPATDQRPGVFA